jgi:hypothetical protein
VSGNLIVPINYQNNIPYLEKSIVANGCVFSFMCSSLEASVVATQFQTKEAPPPPNLKVMIIRTGPINTDYSPACSVEGHNS